MKLQGKSAVLTGVGAGIGKATALLFAAHGARVACTDINETTGQDTVEEIRAAGGEAFFERADTTSAGDTQRVIRDTVESYGRLDIIFNCAGIVPVGRIEDQDEEEWQRCLDVNLTGVFLGCKYAVQQFLRQGDGGLIINMASMAGLAPVKDRLAYCASKYGVVGLTKCIALDYAANQIRCNCICPGTVATESWRQRVADSPDPEQALRDFIARQPLGRVGTPDEIAHAALYLASPEATYITGHALVIDGGMML